MATYRCTVRTNYFRVKDAKEFKKIMENVVADDDIEMFEKIDKNGNEWFGFGCYGNIYGMEIEEDIPDYDTFMVNLQKCVVPGDAIIIFEAGNENLRYTTGFASVITENNIEYVDITDLAIKKAKEMLGNPNFNTECSY